MDRKFIGLMLIFLLSFGLFTTIVVFNKPLSRLTKAKEEFVASPENSLLFAWPLAGKADGNSLVEVNIFVRNKNNLPLENKKVRLSTTLGSIRTNDLTTDKAGKATFFLTSDKSGIAELSAIVDNQILIKQKVSIKFE